MIYLYVLPAVEDQQRFLAGIRPLNTFKREYPTHDLVEQYCLGLESLSDIAEYTILDETATTLTIEFDGQPSTFAHTFDSEAEKNAYLDGLRDGDGFYSARAVVSTYEPGEFARIDAMFEGDPPKPIL